MIIGYDIIVSHSGCSSFLLGEMSLQSTSSPGSSRFSIWRRLGRRPWHTAESRDQNFQGGWKCIQDSGKGEVSERIWVRDYG